MQETKQKVTLGYLQQLKNKSIPASFITAYDFPSACFVNAAEIDLILVGDSGGMTTLGYKSTLPVTMEEMLHFAKAVCRGNRTSFVVGDMPFLSYQPSNELAVLNAGRLIAEAGCDAIKLEGGIKMVERVKAIADSGIAVMGHLGLLPQSLSAAGNYRVYGSKLAEFETILNDALLLEEAGASLLLLEAIPEEPAGLIRDALKIPVYGVGAGKKVDGQLLIFHGLIGAFVGGVNSTLGAFVSEETPRYAKQYCNVKEIIVKALKEYNQEVKLGDFPTQENQYAIDEKELEKIVAYYQQRFPQS